jgi:hypothetical protein
MANTTSKQIHALPTTGNLPNSANGECGMNPTNSNAVSYENLSVK